MMLGLATALVALSGLGAYVLIVASLHTAPLHSARCCVRVPCVFSVCDSWFYTWRLGGAGGHWFHHGVEPALGTRAHELVPRGAVCDVYVPTGLASATAGNAFVRHLFVSILTRGHFSIGRIVDEARSRRAAGACAQAHGAGHFGRGMSAVDTREVRQALWALECAPERNSSAAGRGATGGASGAGAPVLVYDRDSSRRIRNGAEVVSHLRARYGAAAVRHVIHSNERPACELVSMFRAAQIVVLAHGFTGPLMVLMTEGATMVEVFTHGYTYHSYALLAQTFGVRYRPLDSAPTDGTWLGTQLTSLASAVRASSMLARQWLRDHDVVVDLELLDREIHRHLRRSFKT
jgi:hypothetical protein